MAGALRLLVTHPREWAHGGYAGRHGVKVAHVRVGGPEPRRTRESGGLVTHDGRGEVCTEEGLAELSDLAASFRPHVILVTIHFGLTADHLARARKAAGPDCRLVAMHYADQRDVLAAHVERLAPALDAVLVNNRDRQDWRKYEAIGLRVGVLDDGVSPAEYWPLDVPAEFDAFFDGNDFWPLLQRARENHGANPWWVEELHQFSGAEFRHQVMSEINRQFRLFIRGSVGWGREFRVQPMVYHPNLLREIRRGLVVLGTNNLPKYRMVVRRQLRAMAAGRMYLCQAYPGIEEDFEQHVHLAWFNTVEEAVALLRYYLDNSSARERVAEEGRRLVCERHSYEARLVQFVGQLREWGVA